MKDKLKDLHRKARLERDPLATEAYGAALAAIQEGEVRENKDFDAAKMLAVVTKEAGKFKESAEAFANAGRKEKADELSLCEDLLTKLLPAKLNPEVYPQIVAEAISTVSASSMKDMGKIMAYLKKEQGAALDMKIASQQVKLLLQDM